MTAESELRELRRAVRRYLKGQGWDPAFLRDQQFLDLIHAAKVKVEELNFG